MVANNRSEDAEHEFADESKQIIKRLKNWWHWQLCLQSVGTNFSGRAAFYKVPGTGIDLLFDHEDAEVVEAALTIFIRSWSRAQYRKVKNYVTSSMSTAELARNAGLTPYLYKTEIQGLLHKVQYCIEYVEQHPDEF